MTGLSLKSAFMLLVAASIATPCTVAAQALPLGTWSGAMSAPGGTPIPVSFQVGRTDSGLSIVMSSAQVEGEIAFTDVRLQGDSLTFWWEPGVRVECTLTRTDAGGFEGSCSDGSGSGEGILRMVPPAAP